MSDLIYIPGLLKMLMVFLVIIFFACFCERVSEWRTLRRRQKQSEYISKLHRRMAREDRALEREIGRPLHCVPSRPLSSYPSPVEIMSELRTDHAVAQHQYGFKAKVEGE